MFESNRYGVEKVKSDPPINSTITDALGDQYANKHVTADAYSDEKGKAMFHGQGRQKMSLCFY